MFCIIFTYMFWDHELNTVRIQIYVRRKKKKREKTVEFLDCVYSAGGKIHFEISMIICTNTNTYKTTNVLSTELVNSALYEPFRSSEILEVSRMFFLITYLLWYFKRQKYMLTV